MRIDTKINRNLHGAWHANSYVHLTPDTGLRITTSKNSRGKLVTSAYRVRFDEHGAEIHFLFGDFHKFVIVKDVRCTENNVKAQHDAALLLVDSLINECNEFYAKKESNNVAA